MNRDDRIAIEGLFRRLAETDRTAPPRDPEAEAFIADHVGRIPGADYYMAQTIVVQEAALACAEDRIAELEARLSEQRSSGGFLSGLFGEDTPAPMRPGRRNAAPGRAALRSGSGFLGGAAQTAMGVAGGLLIANAISGFFASDVAADGLGGDPFDDPFGDDLGDLDL